MLMAHVCNSAWEALLRHYCCAMPVLSCAEVRAVPADREEDRMQYGAGNEGQGREDAQRERIEKWARWVEEHPEAAAEMAAGTGWRPQDIPRE